MRHPSYTLEASLTSFMLTLPDGSWRLVASTSSVNAGRLVTRALRHLGQGVTVRLTSDHGR